MIFFMVYLFFQSGIVFTCERYFLPGDRNPLRALAIGFFATLTDTSLLSARSGLGEFFGLITLIFIARMYKTNFLATTAIVMVLGVTTAATLLSVNVILHGHPLA